MAIMRIFAVILAAALAVFTVFDADYLARMDYSGYPSWSVIVHRIGLFARILIVAIVLFYLKHQWKRINIICVIGMAVCYIILLVLTSPS
jgi:hypothetical protein